MGPTILAVVIKSRGRSLRSRARPLRKPACEAHYFLQRALRS